MYYQFFGLTKDPFSMAPDPACFFITAAHREALAGLTYAVFKRKGFVLITGDAGTGKTTLLAHVFQSLPKPLVRTSLIFNPTLTQAEFLELALLDFGICNIPHSKAQRLNLLQHFLLDAHQRQQLALLVVDEAHKLPLDVLEEVRLLGNFEFAGTKLLQIVLAGQSELAQALNREELRQLKQRIAVRLSIHPLSATGIEHYIAYRWQKAGGTSAPPFAVEAVAKIAEFSRGLPRLVNAICDNALIVAHAQDSRIVGAKHVIEAAGDLDLFRLSAGSLPLNRWIENPPIRLRLINTEPTMKVPSLKSQREPPMATVTNGNAKSVPPTVPQPATPFPTLDKYQSHVETPSRLKRLAAKLGLSVVSSKPNEQAS